jgi:hypothetical protein
MNDLNWWAKAGIGAIGGLALGMLKLIDAQFFLASVSSVQAQAAYLTYFCYMVLGSAAAVFLSDHELPPPKVRRSAFILGLLAPSVLLAIANQPIKPGSIDQVSKAIPGLGWLPISSAVAQPQGSTGTPIEGGAETKFRTVSRAELEPSFGDAFSAALGRSTLKAPYVYVIGSTDDRQKALLTANKLNAFLASADSGSVGVSPQVLQVQGEKNYFVVVGDFNSQASLYELKAKAAAASVQALSSARAPMDLSLAEQKSLAGLLANAPVVPAKALTMPK